MPRHLIKNAALWVDYSRAPIAPSSHKQGSTGPYKHTGWVTFNLVERKAETPKHRKDSR